MKIAILDLGTNTFNLLIAETAENNLSRIHHSKEPVKLGEGGFQGKEISARAIQRAMSAIRKHMMRIRQYKCEKIYAYATSAFRESINGEELIDKINKKFDLYVNIIPGDREAELIYKGVRQSCLQIRKKFMIIDIGGGSNEIIIADHQAILWKDSLQLGMARLLNKFKPSDPITNREISEVESYLEEKMQHVFEAYEEFRPEIILGASGSFETFHALLTNQKPAKYKINGSLCNEIFPEDYSELHKILIASTIEERKNMPGMEPVRVEMIVLASIFVNFILRKCNIKRIIQSEFALKEGVVAEILNL